jgi:hypothetical protein
MQPWQELCEARRGDASEVYECCRLSALLYSTAIIFPISPHTGWYLPLLAKIKRLLETSDTLLYSEPDEVTHVVLWCLTVAGIAALRTEHRKWFENTLGAALRRNRFSAWEEVRDILGRFVWSDVACGPGAILLWERLVSPEARTWVYLARLLLPEDFWLVTKDQDNVHHTNRLTSSGFAPFRIWYRCWNSTSSCSYHTSQLFL